MTYLIGAAIISCINSFVCATKVTGFMLICAYIASRAPAKKRLAFVIDGELKFIIDRVLSATKNKNDDDYASLLILDKSTKFVVIVLLLFDFGWFQPPP